MRKTFFRTDEEQLQLRRLYVDEKWSAEKIGREIGCDPMTVRKALKRLGIKKRTRSEAAKIRWTDSEEREQRAQITKSLWERPEYRLKQESTREDPEYRRKISQIQLGKGKGRSHSEVGYIRLHSQFGHPLAAGNGELLEHRKVLYEKIGPGEHKCYWCGRKLNWRRFSLIVDHLDGDVRNNSPENLEPSCITCNTRRGGCGNPIDFKPSWVVKE